MFSVEATFLGRSGDSKQKIFYVRPYPKNPDRMTDSEDHDQTAFSGTLSSGSTLFAQT